MNGVSHESTEYIPAELHLGQPPTRLWAKWVIPPELKGISYEEKLIFASQNLTRKGAKRAKKHNELKPFTSFSMGQEVLMPNSSDRAETKEATVEEQAYVLEAWGKELWSITAVIIEELQKTKHELAGMYEMLAYCCRSVGKSHRRASALREENLDLRRSIFNVEELVSEIKVQQEKERKIRRRHDELIVALLCKRFVRLTMENSYPDVD
ncbi:hypothetical protein QAD02_013569 [Eretmocerus hayati]|uniref:Uncharacterized protein n=1 Tax=Eretmocerus hayati TaxID=131215 RepID=A0ACC2P319_9HYME|nr:hypothetical protein QAD02_013569 [Eretmocerus hayati]